jgi:hypothetical protein
MVKEAIADLCGLPVGEAAFRAVLSCSDGRAGRCGGVQFVIATHWQHLSRDEDA